MRPTGKEKKTRTISNRFDRLTQAGALRTPCFFISSPAAFIAFTASLLFFRSTKTAPERLTAPSERASARESTQRVEGKREK